MKVSLLYLCICVCVYRQCVRSPYVVAVVFSWLLTPFEREGKPHEKKKKKGESISPPGAPERKRERERERRERNYQREKSNNTFNN